jgi:hypothetical protein
MFDPNRFRAEESAAYDYLIAFWRSEIRFYEEEYPTENDNTPTAAMILEGLAGSIIDSIDPELGEEYVLSGLNKLADTYYDSYYLEEEDGHGG